MSNYNTLRETYSTSGFKDERPVDGFPFYNKWRNNPLSDDSIIRANVAGYYPYKKSMQQIQIPKIVEPIAIYPNDLIFPKDYPINYPCTTIRSKAPDFVKGNFINTQP